jgi:hypothetical protein
MYDGRSLWLARAIEMNQEALGRDPGSVEVNWDCMVYWHQGGWPRAKRRPQPCSMPIPNSSRRACARDLRNATATVTCNPR